MILTCPQCATQFSVPDDLTASGAKKVRCTLCKHTWEEPSEISTIGVEENIEIDFKDNETGIDAQEDYEDIPESLKQGPDDADMVVPKNAGTNKKISFSKETLIGIAAAVMAGLLILLILIMLHGPIKSLIPASSGFYKIFGISESIIGKSIAFNDLKTSINKDIITLTGEITNLATQSAKVPSIKAEQLDENQQIISSWIISLPIKKLAAAETEKFEITHPAESGVQSIRVSLTGKKPDKAISKQHHKDQKEPKSSPEPAHHEEDHHSSHEHE